MTFDATFPLKVFLNLTRHDDRRREVENELLDAGIDDYERIAAYSAKWVGSWRGYPSAKRYAQALSHRRAVWTGWRRKAGAVLVFADDAVLAPGFKAWFEEIDLPDDWGIFHFGCQHRERPTPAGAGAVRCALTADLQAYAVRASAFRDVSRALTPVGKRASAVAGSRLHSCDDQLGQLCARLPVYAAWPNLAWRRGSGSNEKPEVEDAYTAAGRQLSFPEAVAGLDEEMSERFGGKRPSRVTAGAAGRERFLFCGASEDVSLSERLRGLASLRLLAKLNGQTACLWWPEGRLNLPGLPEDLLEPTGYRCVSDEREWRRLSHGVAKVERASCRLTPEAAIDLARQRGLSAGYTEAELLRLWHTLARDVRPSRVVHARVTAAVENWQARRPLGVHVGRAERSTERAGETLVVAGEIDERARRRVRARMRDEGFDAVFLACDDPAAERAWREWLAAHGIRALGSNRVWRAGRVGQSSIEDRAVELFLLSRCDAIVGTAWSDFSWMASVVGGVAYEAVDRAADTSPGNHPN